MKIEELRNYGKAFSDAESSWPDEVKREMNRIGMKIVFGSLNFIEKVRFAFAFARERRRMSRIDLSDIRAKGMNNESFIKTQIEIAALYSALSQTIGKDRTQESMNQIMEATAPKALGLCMPLPEEFNTFDDTLQAFKAYFVPVPEASRQAGCNIIEIAEDTEDSFQYEMTYCVWYEIAKKLGVPDACLSNCYSDDLFFPDYYDAIGLEYSQTNTIARGGDRCDYRLTRSKRIGKKTGSRP